MALAVFSYHQMKFYHSRDSFFTLLLLEKSETNLCYSESPVITDMQIITSSESDYLSQGSVKVKFIFLLGHPDIEFNYSSY